MKKIAIFASGSGTNADNIIRYFAARGTAEVAVVVSNNPDAYVLTRARDLGVPAEVVSREEFTLVTPVIEKLHSYKVDAIVLAGFLWLVPPTLVEAYRGRIVNIHPALLPAYGGKGMYGERVHQAVVAAGEARSGITIHLVDEHYDRGDTLAQYDVALAPGETPESLAAKVHALEYEHFPREIERFLASW